MKQPSLAASLATATAAARAAGALMRKNLRLAKHVNEASQHDIKLELDVRCQNLIERALRKAQPDTSFFGEEGTSGNPDAEHRWVVDPIDGTVNFAYGIPHACVSIALQRRTEPGKKPTDPAYADGFTTVVGVVFDPFTDDLWTATSAGAAKLNGRRIQVASRARLAEAIVAMGFAKYRHTLDLMLPVFNHLIHRVRKIRMTGSAALAMTYVATGRFDAYVENGVRLWDIAAGGLILERAGGTFWRRAVDGADHDTYEVRVSAPALQTAIQRVHARRP